MLELFHNHRSTCSQKVRICLAELDLAWEDRHVDLATGEHLTERYLKINPNGVVPALVHDGRPVIESTVICEYLDEVFPETPQLTPDDPIERAAMRAWLRYIDEVPSMAVRVPTFNTILPAYQKMSSREFADFADSMPLRKHFFLRMGQDGFDAFETDAAIEQLQRTIDRMEGQLSREGPWLIGRSYTIADICVVPLFARMEDLGRAARWKNHRSVSDWYRRAAARPSFDKAFYEGTRMKTPGSAA